MRRPPTVATAGGGAWAAAGARGASCAPATHAAIADIATTVATVRQLNSLIRDTPFVVTALTLPCALH